MRLMLARHWFLLVLLVGVSAALAWPHAVQSVTRFWEPRWMVAASLFLVAWTMPTRSLLDELRHPVASLWAILLSYGLVPIGSVVLGALAPDADVRLGLILVSCVPCTLSTAVLWTRLAGGNEATALLTVLGTTFLSWFATTAWLACLTGTEVQLDSHAMMLDLVLSLVVPTVLGQALRRLSPCARFAEKHKVMLGGLSQVLVLAIVLKAAASVGDRLHQDGAWDAPRIFFWSVSLPVLLHLVVLASAFFSAGWMGLDRARQIAVAFASSQKTLPIALVLYEQYFKEGFPFAVVPLLAYHIGQLLLDTVIAQRLRSRQAAPTGGAGSLRGRP